MDSKLGYEGDNTCRNGMTSTIVLKVFLYLPLTVNPGIENFTLHALLAFP